MISFTKADRLLQGVVPAVTVRLQESVPVVGQVAVPAEIAALEDELSGAEYDRDFYIRIGNDTFARIYRAKHAVLKRALELIRGKAAIGGNAEVQP